MNDGFVDIGGIDDGHCLNFLFKIHGQSPLDIGQVIIQMFVLAMYI
jgi:hypothetical protein